MSPLGAAASRMVRSWSGRFGILCLIFVSFGWLGLMQDKPDRVSGPLFTIGFGLFFYVMGLSMQRRSDRGVGLDGDPGLLYRRSGGELMKADMGLVGGAMFAVEGLIGLVVILLR